MTGILVFVVTVILVGIFWRLFAGLAIFGFILVVLPLFVLWLIFSTYSPFYTAPKIDTVTIQRCAPSDWAGLPPGYHLDGWRYSADGTFVNVPCPVNTRPPSYYSAAQTPTNVAPTTTGILVPAKQRFY